MLMAIFFRPKQGAFEEMGGDAPAGKIAAAA